MPKDPKTRDELFDEPPYISGEDSDDSEVIANSNELYQWGKSLLLKAGFLIRPTGDGRYVYHKVYNLKRPCLDDTDIDYPENFKVWREIYTDTERQELFSIIAAWSTGGSDYENLFKFWKPFLAPNKNKNSPIYMFTENLLGEQAVQQKMEAGTPFELFLTPNPVTSPSESFHPSHRDLAPIKFIPRLEWFPECVRGVTVGDILTIYPDVEAELLSLIIGRAVVGRSNHIPPGYEDPIIHTSRMGAFIVGEDPGLGKTTLFTALFEALQTTGYDVQTFDTFGSKFNLGEVVLADIIYKDDTTDDEFKSLSKSGVAKSVISSSGAIRVQNKGTDAYNVIPMGVIFANMNSWNPRTIYGIDPGMAERVKLISTVREAELALRDYPELSKGTPDPRPFIHLPWLAEKLGTSKHTLMLWLARLCADKFLDLIGDPTSLEKRVDYLSQRLRFPLTKETTSQVMTLALFAHYLECDMAGSNLKRLWKDPSIQGISWSKLFVSLQKLNWMLRDHPELIEWIREDYELKHSSDILHPYHGLKVLDWNSLAHWMMCKESDSQELKAHDQVAYLATAFKTIRQSTGLPFSSDEVWLTKAFERIKYYLNDGLKAVAKDALEYKDCSGWIKDERWQVENG